MLPQPRKPLIVLMQKCFCMLNEKALSIKVQKVASVCGWKKKSLALWSDVHCIVYSTHKGSGWMSSLTDVSLFFPSGDCPRCCCCREGRDVTGETGRKMRWGRWGEEEGGEEGMPERTRGRLHEKRKKRYEKNIGDLRNDFYRFISRIIMSGLRSMPQYDERPR